MSPGKPITIEGLRKDLDYTLYGTLAHSMFFKAMAPIPELDVLEAGCGSGKFGLAYAAELCNVTLVDIDSEVLKYTKALYGLFRDAVKAHGKVDILECDIHSLVEVFGYNKFDYVFNEGIAHHWPDSDSRRQTCIDQMVKVCKKDGVVSVMVSNAICPEMMDYAKRVDHTYHSMPPKQQPFYPFELLKSLKKAGLIDVKIEPVGPSLKDSLLLLGYGTKP